MLTDEQRANLEAEFRKMLYPTPFMRWLESLEGAERVGRIKRSKLSTLRYGLRAYIQRMLPGTSANYKVTVDPLDTEVDIFWSNPTLDPAWIEISLTYPYWLRDYLDDDENYDLFVQDAEDTNIQEVCQRIYEWCMSHPPYDLLVRPA